MKKITQTILLIVLFSAGAVAQNLLSNDFFTCDGTYTDVWSTIHKNPVDGEIAEFNSDPLDASNNCLKLDNGSSTGQARVASDGTNGVFDLTNGVKYVLKVDRYVSSSTVATGDKLYIYQGTAKKVTLTNVGFSVKDAWKGLEYEFTAPADLADCNVRIQVNPGAATVYYDNFSLEALADMNDVTFNIARPEGSLDNVWITLGEESQFLKGSTDVTTTTFSLEETGTYNYAIVGKSYEPTFGILEVNGDMTVSTKNLVTDAVSTSALSFYACQVAGETQGVASGEKINSGATIYREGITVYHSDLRDGHWPGNMNSSGVANEAGAMLTYRLENAEGDVKTGFITPAIEANGNGNHYEYFGYFKAGFVVKNAAGAYVDAQVSITENNATAEVLKTGMYIKDLKNDGTTYNYSITAEGYAAATGTVWQTGVAVEKDTIVNVVLSVNSATNVAVNQVTAVKVYPNPATSTISIDAAESGIVKLYSLSGALVKVARWNNESKSISVADLNRGVYFLNFEGEMNTYTNKIVLE